MSIMLFWQLDTFGIVSLTFSLSIYFPPGAEHQDRGRRADSARQARDEGGRRPEFRLKAVRAKILPSVGGQAGEDHLLPQQGVGSC